MSYRGRRRKNASRKFTTLPGIRLPLFFPIITFLRTPRKTEEDILFVRKMSFRTHKKCTRNPRITCNTYYGDCIKNALSLPRHPWIFPLAHTHTWLCILRHSANNTEKDNPSISSLSLFHCPMTELYPAKIKKKET